MHSPIESPARVRRANATAGEIRGWIVDQLAVTLKVPVNSIDCSAPLHSLGADSVTALTITGTLAERLQRELPVTLMWDHGSITEVADALAAHDDGASSRGGTVVPSWNVRGERQPLFCFPGIGGYPVNVAALGSHMGPEQPCYSLISPGLSGESAPLEHVEAIAAKLLEQMRSIQPHGPYQLLGYSFGGLLAFETAQQLVAAGESVALLALFDTFAPQGLVARPRWQRAALHAYVLLAQPRRSDYLRTALGRLRHGRRERTLLADAHPGSPGELPQRQALAVKLANERAAARYQPSAYAGPVLLLRAQRRAQESLFFRIERERNGWGPHVANLHIVDLPCGHYGMLAAENLPIVAGALRPRLGL